jgi:hypothetical protein
LVSTTRRARIPAPLSACASLAHRGTYHLGRLSAANGELQVGVFLPVAEEERELGEEAVVDVADELDGRRAGVARDAAFEVLRAGDQRLPLVEFILVLDLKLVSNCAPCFGKLENLPLPLGAS